MTISNQEVQFFNKTVVDFDAGDDVSDLEHRTYRLDLDYDDELTIDELLGEFLQKADPAKLDALIIGMWGIESDDSAQTVIDLLIAEHARLPALKALFIGDITYEQNEISWIIQGSYKPLLDAFPALEVLRIRGSTDLRIEPFEHRSLRQLIVECGGLPSEIAANLAKSTLPALEHLELWLGTDNYGFDGSVATYQSLFTAINPVRLKYLGLRDAEIADDLAVFLAAQPWLAQIETLDLSLGTLGDTGARALIASPYVRELKTLNVSHHYMSDQVMAELKALPIVVVADDQEVDDGDRYVAVGE